MTRLEHDGGAINKEPTDAHTASVGVATADAGAWRVAPSL
jgi:hypothetical protein